MPATNAPAAAAPKPARKVDPDQLFNAREACREMRIGEGTFRKLIAAGKLKYGFAGRGYLIRGAAINAYAESGEGRRQRDSEDASSASGDQRSTKVPQLPANPGTEDS